MSVYYTVLGGCGGGWFLFYAPTIAQDWLLSRADINKLVKLKYYQANNELISTANDANRLDLSLSGSYPVKVSSLKMPAKWKYGLQGFYGTLKSMSMAFMDSMSMATVQTLGLQQMRREAAIESAPKAPYFRGKEKASSCSMYL